MKPKIIVVLGPTATGKSDLAVEIAKKYNGEIISADSRQVYTDLNIGTGKITKKEMRGVKHYMLDVASPKRKFSVNQFKKQSEKVISDILKRNKVPIIAGGTGYYIDALVDGIKLPEVKPNHELRKTLEKETTEKLFETLKKLDKDRANNIDKDNKVRLIRAIEVASELGKVPKPKKIEKYNVLKIGLNWPEETLKERIKTRLIKRVRVGMIREAEKLHQNGLSFKRMNELGLEYRYLAEYLQKNISKEEMIELLNTKIWQYSKRQMTWFKRDKKIKWFNPLEIKKIFKEVDEFLNSR